MNQSSTTSMPADVEQLDEALSRPTPYVIEALRRLEGDVLVLGVAGKMGPTLARMARRALDELGGPRRRVIGVARFSEAAHEARLIAWGVETIRADLLRDDLARLPDAPNVVYMAGMKFGSTGQEPTTWAMNTLLPARVCQRYPRSRIAAFSTGNVYGLTPVSGGGSKETDTPNPVGEYAMSCLGRERMFQWHSQEKRTPVVLIRLNYASELRYGVLVDIATRLAARQPIDLAMGHLNAIWQRDANAISLASLGLASSPAAIINIAGPELISVRAAADRMARQMGVPVAFTGREAAEALLSNSQHSVQLFGPPTVTAEQLMDWTAKWVAAGGALLNKPTHFESRDGKF